MVQASTIVASPAKVSIPLIRLYPCPGPQGYPDPAPAPLVCPATNCCHQTSIAASHDNISFICKQRAQLMGLRPPVVVFSEPCRAQNSDLKSDSGRWLVIIHLHVITHAGSPFVTR